MTKDKPVKKEIVYEPIPAPSELVIIQRILGEIAKAFGARQHEPEPPVIA